MIYEPNRLPFWEIRRGDGPFTRLKWRREKWRHLNKGKHDFSSLSGSESITTVDRALYLVDRELDNV